MVNSNHKHFQGEKITLNCCIFSNLKRNIDCILKIAAGINAGEIFIVLNGKLLKIKWYYFYLKCRSQRCLKCCFGAISFRCYFREYNEPIL